MNYTHERSNDNRKFPVVRPESPALTGKHVNSERGKLRFFSPSPVFLFPWEINLKGIKQ
jgi:hypothetical protein